MRAMSGNRRRKAAALPMTVAIVLVAWHVSLLADESFGAESLDADHAAKMKQGLDVFKTVVRPVLIGRCVKCHGGESTESDFDLNTREGLLRGGDEGSAVELGAGKSSRFYKLVAHLDEPTMPEDGAKLPDAAVTAIAKWIDLGAPYDRPLVDDKNDPLAWTRRTIDEAGREFWSFQPLARVEPPAIDDAWVRTPIDRFVLAGLRAQQLTPNPRADRRTLIRRLYFDVIGLPPTPEQWARFAKDESAGAYDQLLDELLDSEHFGERWARHWLDVARFAESHGFEQDYDRPHAYHFRDFVIRALNSDMPYDQFVRWQLAGDEIAPDEPLALMATGFLGAGAFPTQLTEKEFEPARYDELDDMAATMGTAMLGLTIGCARCHDHKYDPIPSSDYYRLISTFATTIRSELEIELHPESTLQATRAWQQEHDQIVAARTAFEEEQLPQRFQRWLDQGAKIESPQPAWILLDLIEYQSAGGATLTRQDDGSLLASGKNPDFDRYTLVAQTQLTGISAIRLEALAHESMVRGGPGRASNGNMGLGNFTVVAEPLSGDAPAVTVKLTKPVATFQQNTGNLSIAASIDSDKRSGWAVDPQFGKDHAAAFETVESIGFPGGTRLVFTLEFDVNNHHNIGRPRLAISTRPRPVGLDAESEGQQLVEISAILDKTRRVAAEAGRPAALNLDAQQRRTLLSWYRSTDAEWRQLDERVQSHLQIKPKPELTKVMVTSEGVKPIPHHADGRGFPHFYKDTYFLQRGDPTQKQGKATPGFLQVLMPSPAATGDDTALASLTSPDSIWQHDPPEDWHTSYRRLSLADWITDTERGAGHLLARVIVNRIWQHYLDRGIVATPNDFGFQGSRPTHPELLDWLAQRLIQEGWRMKPIHKLILQSAVYQQTGTFDAADAAKDPDNQWYWKHEPARLEAEIIRDAMLSISGRLDRRMLGPGTLDEGSQRRSIYFMIKRSKLIPMMQLFDAPEPLVSQGERPSTTIAPQALMFMNNPHVRDYARGLAQRLMAAADQSQEAAIREAYRNAIAKVPTADEQSQAVSFLKAQLDSYQAEGKANARELALTDFCQVLMSLNEFVFID